MQASSIFKDRSGKIVIIQAPNLPLYAFGAFYLLRLSSDKLLILISHWGSTICLLYWAFWEITKGVNIWRRFLGLTVAAYIIVKAVA